MALGWSEWMGFESKGRLKMAGDWIKWVKGLSRKSEVLLIAMKLKMDRRIIATACMELWEWADSETVDGHISGANGDFVDGLVSLPGFFGALEGVGWARATAAGITICNWGRHNGDSAKKRAQDNDRQRSKRARDAAPLDVTDTSRNQRDIQRDKPVTREQKRTEEKTVPNTTAAETPADATGTAAEMLMRLKPGPGKTPMSRAQAEKLVAAVGDDQFVMRIAEEAKYKKNPPGWASEQLRSIRDNQGLKSADTQRLNRVKMIWDALTTDKKREVWAVVIANGSTAYPRTPTTKDIERAAMHHRGFSSAIMTAAPEGFD